MISEGPPTIDRHVDAGFAMAGWTYAEDSIIAHDDGITLAFHGDIVEVAGLRVRLLDQGVEGASRWPVARVLLGLYRRFGTEALCGLNGLYVVCIWEAATGKLTIIGDRYGYQKLYYWQGSSSLVFASEQKAIIAHPRFEKKIDPIGLSQLLGSSFLLEDNTLFEGIRRIPSGGVTTFYDGRLDHKQYWDFSFGPPDATLTEEDVLEEFAERLRTAVGRVICENSCLLLTGGNDSRSIAGAISPDTRPARLYAATAGHAHCHDVRFGRGIANRIDVPHIFLPIGPNYLEETASQAMARTEGTITSHVFWNALFEELTEKHGLSTMIKGAFSCVVQSVTETVSKKAVGYERWPEGERAIRFYMDRLFCRGFLGTDLKALLRPSFYEGVETASEDAVLRAFRKAPVENPILKVDYALTTIYERHFMMSGNALAGGRIRTFNPYLDNDLADFSFHTRHERPVGDSLTMKMIARHFPHVAGVPKTSSALPITGHPLANKARRGWMRFYHHVLPAATFGRLGGHDYSAYAHYNEWFRHGGRSFFERTMAQEELFEEFLDPTAVRTVVANHMSGKTNDYSQLCILLTLVLWRKTFW
jgi:hypothetical protein